ncbi:MAG TPA: iron-containing alcohol dehydrogenase [Candidatus Borkfalkia avistercoris]|uniref:Iron-containing alcohol dehydrogenase n=1 Tax=Candidatus Borkfalkia avistercoris TaxID=2838504 RepID=A0A9D2CZQ9_9FIRM|nr:iron-containing alcohol dehydrogenase [Candidatus Borkfalkia avistercoris]
MDFRYYMPVKIVCGRDCVRKNAPAFAEYGKKALVVTGKSSSANGALADVTAALAENGQEWLVYDKIPPNPTVDCVREGGALARGFGADFVVAIGGGSPMDAAKAIAMLARQDAGENIFAYQASADVLPMLHVPTTAGTGSEVTPYAILTNDEKETKTSISNPAYFPKAAFLDGKYMLGLPRDTTVYTAIDAMSHAMEGMLSVRAGALTDALAKESLRVLRGELPALASGRLSEEDRDALLYAATLAGMVIANTGTSAVHSMGYSLTYFHGAPHGRANGLLLPEFFAVCEEKSPARAKEILNAAGFSSPSEFAAALAPLLGEREKISDELLHAYAKKASVNKNIKNCSVFFDEADLFRVLKASVGC